MKIIYSPEASEDIKSLYDFISEVQGARQAATNVVSKIKSAVKDLKIFPNRHRVWDGSDFRFFLVNGYYVFYRFNESTETIHVERIIHSRRNIDELI